MSKLNTTTLWCDDVYCDLLLTSDSTLAQTKDKRKYCWLLMQHPMAVDWIPLHTCILYSCAHVSSSCLGKIFPQEVKTREYFPITCSDPCSWVPCCSSVSVCDWEIHRKESATNLQSWHRYTAPQPHRVVQFWHQSLITIFGAGADWLHLLDASKYWQPLWSAIPNLNSTCCYTIHQWGCVPMS